MDEPAEAASPQVAPFDLHHDRYEAWFEEHDLAYGSELLALRLFVPLQGRGLEVGVGSGRFAAPLGIQVGIDPSAPMLDHARRRGIDVVRGFAENLPFTDDSFDHVLVVTTLCFVRSAQGMLEEARRGLRPGGRLIIGFVDRDSPLGQQYLARRAQSLFYGPATFYSATEVDVLLRKVGFTVEGWAQTLFHPLEETTQLEAAHTGHGQGGFVVVAATSPD